MAEVNAREIAEPARDILCVVDDERPFPGDVAAVPHLPATGADVSTILAALNVTENADGLDDRQRVLGLGDVVCVDDEGNGRNIGNAVPACLHKGRVG